MKKIPIMFFSILLTACSTTPDYDMKFGQAVREARLSMTLNPDASRNTDVVAGLDGKSAREAILLYQGTFKTPPPVTNVINIGRSGGGDSGK